MSLTDASKREREAARKERLEAADRRIRELEIRLSDLQWFHNRLAAVLAAADAGELNKLEGRLDHRDNAARSGGE